MNTIEQLFPNLATFIEYAPGVDTNKNFTDYLSSARSAKKSIEAIISPSVYAAIMASKAQDLLDALRAAMANRILAMQLVFDAVARRKSGTDVYKYEIEAMKRSYMENYFAAMDSLIQQLMAVKVDKEEKNTPTALWQSSRYCRLLLSCQLRSAEEFDLIYPIDLSYLFFFRTVPLQKECLDERLAAYFVKAEGKENVLDMLRLALAKKTVAKSLRRFDILEFPSTIRELFEDNKAFRNGSTEHDNAIKLAALLDNEADTLLTDADLLLEETSVDVCSYSQYNDSSDLIIMTP